MTGRYMTRRRLAEGVVKGGREAAGALARGLNTPPAGHWGPPVFLPEVWTTRGSRSQTCFRSTVADQAHRTRVSGV